MSSMHQGFAPIDFSNFGDLTCENVDEEAPEALPSPGTANLVIEDRCQPLFTSAEWTLVATVGQQEIGRSTSQDRAHERSHIERWARELVLQNRQRLRRLGVDVEKTYLTWKGALDDLYV